MATFNMFHFGKKYIEHVQNLPIFQLLLSVIDWKDRKLVNDEKKDNFKRLKRRFIRIYKSNEAKDARNWIKIGLKLSDLRPLYSFVIILKNCIDS